jgi:hypothetical protein
MLLFLGAGASNPFGIPTMSGFLKIFDKEFGDSSLYQAIKVYFGGECDLEVLMTVVEDLSKSREELFRTISPQTALFLLQKTHEEAKSYISEENRKAAKTLVIKIKQSIRTECVKAVRNDAIILRVYDDFFDLLQREREMMTSDVSWGQTQIGRSKMILPSDLRIFTTNYDTCTEVYFNRKEIDFSNGTIARFGENVFDIDSYELPQTINVKIYKLHGSVDLFQKGDKIRRLSASGAERTYMGEEYGEELMRWPIEFGGYRHVIESPYLDLFRKLRDAAKEENWWIIIGFSFRDRTICSLLDDVLRLKPKIERPKALLLDLHPQPIVNRLNEWNYHALAETVYPVEVGFGSNDISSKIHEAFLSEGFIKELDILTGRRK